MNTQNTEIIAYITYTTYCDEQCVRSYTDAKSALDDALMLSREGLYTFLTFEHEVIEYWHGIQQSRKFYRDNQLDKPLRF